VPPHEVQQSGLDHAPIVGAATATGSRQIAAAMAGRSRRAPC
jgi:hypothetical protein